MGKRVLIVEGYAHYKVLENIYHLLKNVCSVTFYISRDKHRSDDLLFPSAKKANVIVNKLHNITLLVWLPFFGWKYDFINISTGPEGNHYTNIINVIFFYINCVIFRNKIILTVKNIRPYLDSSAGLFSFIRSKGIKKLSRFTFETRTMRNVFIKHSNVKNYFTGISYDRYTDLLNPRCEQVKKNNNKEGRFRIGLLGVVDQVRRDYGVIIEALMALTEAEKGFLEFVTLGACFGGNKNEIVQQLSKYAKVNCQDGILDATEFDAKGMSCNVLISPLREEMEYGAFHGSGSFGDAVYLRKKIILPYHVDKEKEFEDIALYYENSSDLAEIFKRLRSPDMAVSQEFYEKFHTKNVLTNLIRDLSLCRKKELEVK